MNTFKILFPLVSLLIATASSFAGPNDIPYYNFTTRQSFLFYADNGQVMRISCPGGKVLKSRSDCNQSTAQPVVSLASAADYFVQLLPSLVSTPVDLIPLKQSDISTLIKGPVSGIAEAKTNLIKLKQQEADSLDVLKKFGEEPGARKELTETQSQIVEVQSKINSNAAYQQTLNDFNQLVQAFLKPLTDSKQWMEVIDSRAQNRLEGYFAKAMTYQSPIARSCNGTETYGSVAVGTVLILPSTPPYGGYSNWDVGTAPYVGRAVRVTALKGFNSSNCLTISTDLPGGDYLLRAFDYYYPVN